MIRGVAMALAGIALVAVGILVAGHLTPLMGLTTMFGLGATGLVIFEAGTRRL